MAKRFYVSRRTFLRDCAAVAAATGLPMWFVERELSAAPQAPATTSPNDRPGIALVGCGGMGVGDAKNAARFGDVVAVCDADEAHAAGAAKTLGAAGKPPEQFTDFRRVLERKDVHVIVQATPDHWHTLINLAAAAAGKDVYSEKPLTLTIDEGKRLVKPFVSARSRLQTGTQQRSDKRFRLACELVRNGRLGKLNEVQGFVPAGLREGPFKTVPGARRLNWDMWLGQAPKVDYVKERTHAHLPLLVRLLRRHDHRLGRAPQRHRPLGHRPRGTADRVEAKRLDCDPIPGGYTTPPASTRRRTPTPTASSRS